MERLAGEGIPPDAQKPNGAQTKSEGLKRGTGLA